MDEYEDVMKQQWCCLNCNAVFGFGKIVMRGEGLHCKHCDSTNLHPADKKVVELDEYHGEKGTLQ